MPWSEDLWTLAPDDPNDFEGFHGRVRVPRQAGELVGGLVRMKHELRARLLNVEEYLAVLEQRREDLRRIMAQVELELQFAPPECTRELAERVERNVRSRSLNIQALFEVAVSLMAHYVEDGNLDHIDRGLLLAARAERDLLELTAHCQARHPVTVLLRQEVGWRHAGEAHLSLDQILTDSKLCCSAAIAQFRALTRSLREPADPSVLRPAVQSAQSAALRGLKLLLNPAPHQ